MKRFRRGLVIETHRLLYHSTLGLRVIEKREKGSRVSELALLFLGFSAWGLPVPEVEKELGTKTRKVDIRLPGKGNSNSYGARPVH